MKKVLFIAALASAVLLSSLGFAQSAPKTAKGSSASVSRKAKHSSSKPRMTDEEHQAFMEKKRQEWESLTPAEREKRFEEMRQRRQAEFDALSKEEQERRKAQLEKRRQEWEALTEEEKEARKKEFRQKMDDAEKRGGTAKKNPSGKSKKAK